MSNFDAGRAYILSDPCYAVPDKLWTSLLDSRDCFNASVGVVTTDEGNTFAVLGFHTTNGDGYYYGSDVFLIV